jgi:Tfp pilus assembly protein PilF
MSLSFLRRPRVLIVLAAVVVVALGGVGFFVWRATRLPGPGDPRYAEYVQAFEIGTAALDSGSGLYGRAEEYLSRAIQLIPQEPAAWANRGLLYFRNGEMDKAASDFDQASKLAPDNPDIEEIFSLLAENRGNLDKAIEHINQALKKTPDDPRRLYRKAWLIERQNEPDADEQRQKIYERILQERPSSLPILTRLGSVAARRKDRPALLDALKRLEKLAPTWGEPARAAFAKVKKDAQADPLPPDLEFFLHKLGNWLKGEPGYARSGLELEPPPSQAGTTFQNFLRLARPRTEPDEPDTELTFEPDPPATADLDTESRWDQVLPVWLDGTSGPTLVVASSRAVRLVEKKGRKDLPFPSGPKAIPPTSIGVLPIDWRNNSLTDFVLAGAGGLRFFSAGTFEDVTAATKLPPSILKGDYHGAWAIDIDMDGDLDIVLAPRKGGVTLLRNNFDGTFMAVPIFPGVESPRVLVWADLDNDGAPDAALLDAEGRLHVFLNERSGQFRKLDVPNPETRYAALAIADVNDDGQFDLIALTQAGALVRMSHPVKGQSWEVKELARLDRKWPLVPGEVRLLATDLDSNGASDLVVRTAQGGVAFLADGKGNFRALPTELPPGTGDIFPLRKGKLCVPALDTGKVTCFRVAGTKGYYSDEFRLRAHPIEMKNPTGDNRVNSYGLGSETELRTGMLIVKQPILQPATHVGLGRRNRIDVLRIVWPNGGVQYEFEKECNAVLRIEQRLKGSCPFLFSWDGQKMVFVTDFCWSSPLGMYINAQAPGVNIGTTDWVKVRGDQLRPRDGLYDLRVNANLWETDYLDYLSLMVVDHPSGTEMHVDERFFLTPTTPRIYLTGPSQPVKRAWDHQGKEVTHIVKAIDGDYLDRAGRGLYQGVTRDHWVEIEPGEVPGAGPVYLLAHGWIHPTDSSINFALEQSSHDRPRPLTLEIPDGKGGWKQAGPPLGFPAGKNKTLVIRIDGLDGQGVPQRLRLRTNLEIFWDALLVARGLDEKQCRTTTLAPKTADLRFRGLVRMSQANRSSPEVAHYDEVICRGPFWRDLEGYHTRFGDVRELLKKVDDRYVIMNAGDELRLTFQAPAAPPAGWKRDFVWICDGWTKDGDLNTRFGRTVLPLPSHDLKRYDTPPGRLQDDPVYKRFPRDWEVYHTRYVTPAVFQRGLRSFRPINGK